MEKEQIKEKLEELKETYEKVTARIEQLKQQKYRLEGQYGAYEEMLKEGTDEKLTEELGE